MTESYFITGTGTGVGKTYIACKLIEQYVGQGYNVVGMKPIAAGCDLVNGEWLNEDVKLLTEASNIKAPKALINPYCFKDPIAPHIAAEKEGVTIQLQVIKEAYDALEKIADIVIVEGAGGLLVPINQHQTIADIIKKLNIPTILVVGIQLGCINTTFLTIEALKSRRLPIRGWVANPIDSNMLMQQENKLFLKNSLLDIKQLDIV